MHEFPPAYSPKWEAGREPPADAHVTPRPESTERSPARPPVLPDDYSRKWKHIERLNSQIRALGSADTVARRAGLDVTVGPGGTRAIVHAMEALQGAWQRGELVDTSAYVSIGHREANAIRSTLEEGITNQIFKLQDHLRVELRTRAGAKELCDALDSILRMAK